MQEKEKNACTVNFLSVFGNKIVGGEHYDPKDDVTDQRAPVNNPEALYNQFVRYDWESIADQLEEEITNEVADDFDNDQYPYENRSELGEDIAEMSRRDLKAAQLRFAEAQKKKKESKSEEPAKADDEPAD